MIFNELSKEVVAQAIKSNFKAVSSLQFKFLSVSDYGTLLDKYDQELLSKLEQHDPSLLRMRIFVIEVKMEPEDMHWM